MIYYYIERKDKRMNVFDAIYSREDNSLERSFIAAETALDIAVDRALQEYEYSMKLLSVSNNRLFIEAENQAQPQTNRVPQSNGLLQTIFEAIGTFFETLLETIVGIFDTRTKLTPEAYFKDPNVQIQMSHDVRARTEAVEDGIRKGKALLQKIATTTGVPDEEVDEYIKETSTKVKKGAPIVITGAVGLGLSLFFKKKMKDNYNLSRQLAEDGTAGPDTNPREQAQKAKVSRHMRALAKYMGDSCKEWLLGVTRASKDGVAEIPETNINGN